MEELIKKYPSFEKEIKDFFKNLNLLRSLKEFRDPGVPNREKMHDIPIHFVHFVNISHLRLISQLDLLEIALQKKNPESFSLVRGCMETIAALAFITDEINKKRKVNDYDKIYIVLYRAVMGQHTLTPKMKAERRPESFNVMDYIDGADKLVTRALSTTPNKLKGAFKEQYDTLSEFTHPNYDAFSLYWEAKDNRFHYEEPFSGLRSIDFGFLIHHIVPLLYVYQYFLSQAGRLVKELNTLTVETT